ncbi:MAG TPA: DUF4129 domain-containing protein [Dermatophilaceae bacterium]
MTPAIGSPPTGLSPSPPVARTWLEQELHGADYQSSLLDSVGRWIVTQLSKLLEGAGHLAGLAPLVTVLIALVVIALLAWVLPKVRREPVVARSDRAVIEDLAITARLYRDLAARAVQDGRYDDAVLDGFRAVAKNMSDRRLLNDAPGRTAHEVSLALAMPFPGHADRLARAADLFDSVRYGHRHASAHQAGQISALDDELVTTRPLLPDSLSQGLPV